MNNEERELELLAYLSSKDAFKAWVKEVSERLNYLEAKTPFRAESEQQDNLRKAIALASLDCKTPEQNGTNMYKKPVSSLEDLQTASKDACRKHGIGITFYETKDESDNPILLSTVTHAASGEFKVYTTPAEPVKNDNPAYARAGGYTYAKRKFLQALLNLGGDIE